MFQAREDTSFKPAAFIDDYLLHLWRGQLNKGIQIKAFLIVRFVVNCNLSQVLERTQYFRIAHERKTLEHIHVIPAFGFGDREFILWVF
jgi:hypothetical protein